MLRIFYNYYVLFYSRVLVQPDPHFVSILALSFIESLWLNAIIDTVSIVGFCYKIGKWPMIGILILLLFVNFKFYGSKSFQKVTAQKSQMFFGSHTLTILIVALISVLGISWLFWGSFFARSFLQTC